MAKRSAFARFAVAALWAIGVVAGLVALIPLFALFLMFGRFLILGLFVLVIIAIFLGRSAFAKIFWAMFIPDPLPVRYKGFILPTSEWLYADHSWSRREGERVTVGVDTLLANVLGPPDHIDLPNLGQKVEAGQRLVRLQRGARSLEVVAPLAGTIRAINYRLLSQPAGLHESPYNGGWLCRIEPVAHAVSRPHHRSPDARQWLREEIDWFVFQRSGELPTEASSAEAAEAWTRDLYRRVGDDTWQAVTHRFFGTRDE